MPWKKGAFQIKKLKRQSQKYIIVLTRMVGTHKSRGPHIKLIHIISIQIYYILGYTASEHSVNIMLDIAHI